jgi:hypothetical protein
MLDGRATALVLDLVSNYGSTVLSSSTLATAVIAEKSICRLGLPSYPSIFLFSLGLKYFLIISSYALVKNIDFSYSSNPGA